MKLPNISPSATFTRLSSSLTGGVVLPRHVTHQHPSQRTVLLKHASVIEMFAAYSDTPPRRAVAILSLYP